MPARVLYGDLSKFGHVTLAIGRDGGAPQTFERFDCTSLDQLEGDLSAFLRAQDALDLHAAAFSACGWEQAGGLSMHNHNFSISRAWLKDILRIQRLHLVNDCVAMAMSVEHGSADDMTEIHAAQGDDLYVKALIAAGVGLGTAAILPEDGTRSIVLPCEGGHSALPVAGDEEIALAKVLRARFPHLSRECVISSGGLVELHAALVQLHGGGEAVADASDVIARARAGDERAKRAIAVMSDWLAAMASDIALMLGARGGIYLTGALLEAMGDLIDRDAFSRRYADKGRLSDYVSKVPVFHFTLPEQMIRGLSTLFERDYH